MRHPLTLRAGFPYLPGPSGLARLRKDSRVPSNPLRRSLASLLLATALPLPAAAATAKATGPLV